MRQHTFIRFACKTNERMLPHNHSTVQYSTHLHTNNTQHDKKNKQYVEQHKKQYIEQHKNVIGIVRVVPRLGELYPGICLTTEEKARKTLSQGS
jgi:hypothetical protein